MTIRIYIEFEDLEGELELNNGQPITIGRSSKCSVQVKDSECSGKHCSIELINGNTYVKDLNSLNGTRINGEEITDSRLYLGDLVEFGKVRVQLLRDDMTHEERRSHLAGSRKSHKREITINLEENPKLERTSNSIDKGKK
ncbi:MAG: FHA domain-containing protein [Bacteriovoracaceae bacterium]|nr:FHA domain-containing protein [Bacteriovoracaceae bacterium]